MESYNTYLEHPAKNVLPVEEAVKIYENLVETIESCKAEDKDEFVQDLIEKAINYSNIRANWELWNQEKRMSEDQGRSITHNSLIDAFNILSRLLKTEGIDTPWRDALGDERKRIGDFACFMVYMIGINNR